jgi:hypothetical protein
MQAPTHILAGKIIQQLTDRRDYQFLVVALTFFLGLLFHAIFDKLARMTYHPPNADFTDYFWVFYHLLVLLTTIVFLYLYGAEAKWGIFFSILPDLDWVFIHGQTLLGIEIPVYRVPRIHQTINWVMDNIPPFTLLNLLPDYRFFYWAISLEVAFVGVLLLIIHRIKHSRRNIHF